MPAGRRRMPDGVDAADRDVARIGLQQPDDLGYERGLAGAVAAHQAHHLPGTDARDPVAR